MSRKCSNCGSGIHNLKVFRDFESGSHEIVGINDISTIDMVDSRMYTPTALAHQFSSEMRYGNSGAEDICVWPSDFFLVWSRLLQSLDRFD